MFSKLITRIVFAASLVLAHNQVSAVVITFDELHGLAGTCRNLNGDEVIQDFKFADSSGNFSIWGCQAGVSHTGSSTALTSASPVSHIVLNKVDNSAFSLSSIDAAARTDVSGGVETESFTIFGMTFDNIEVSQMFEFDGFSFSTFNLSNTFSNLRSVNFKADGAKGQFFIDNLVLDESFSLSGVSGQSNPIPAPATLGIMALGILLIVRFGRAKRSKQSKQS